MTDPRKQQSDAMNSESSPSPYGFWGTELTYLTCDRALVVVAVAVPVLLLPPVVVVVVVVVVVKVVEVTCVTVGPVTATVALLPVWAPPAIGRQ